MYVQWDSHSAMLQWGHGVTNMIMIIIQKLQDITDLGWQLKSEYDDCIKVLNAKLREQDSLINQLKDQTAALMQELKGSTTEVHWFYDDFSLHMNVSRPVSSSGDLRWSPDQWVTWSVVQSLVE